MSEYQHQVNLKFSGRLYDALNLASEFEGIKPSELLRDWAREKLAGYRKDRLYLRWLEKKEKRETKKDVVDLSKNRRKRSEEE